MTELATPMEDNSSAGESARTPPSSSGPEGMYSASSVGSLLGLSRLACFFGEADFEARLSAPFRFAAATFSSSWDGVLFFAGADSSPAEDVFRFLAGEVFFAAGGGGFCIPIVGARATFSAASLAFSAMERCPGSFSSFNRQLCSERPRTLAMGRQA